MYGKILSRDDLAGRLKLLRDTGHRIIFTNGCFDILHYGHISYLVSARSLGDKLVVGVNDDAGVQKLKGAGRPVNTLEDRMAMLAALQAVDYVVSFSEDTPEELVQALRPHVMVKGGDYSEEEVAGGRFVRSLGGEVVILPFEKGYSSSGIISKIRNL